MQGSPAAPCPPPRAPPHPNWPLGGRAELEPDPWDTPEGSQPISLSGARPGPSLAAAWGPRSETGARRGPEGRSSLPYWPQLASPRSHSTGSVHSGQRSARLCGSSEPDLQGLGWPWVNFQNKLNDRWGARGQTGLLATGTDPSCSPLCPRGCRVWGIGGEWCVLSLHPREYCPWAGSLQTCQDERPGQPRGKRPQQPCP